MPAYNFDANGNLSNSTNLPTIAAAGTTNYLMYNFSGSTAILDIELSADLTATITKTTGEMIVLSGDGANPFTIGEDEIVHVSVANAGTGAEAWRVNTAMGNHGTSRSRGTGHTSSYTMLAPAIFVATI